MSLHADFTFGRSKRTNIFIKRSVEYKFPPESKWTCPCTSVNDLTEVKDQYCPKCGTHLRIQEQREDAAGFNKTEGVERITIVRVAHFTVREDQKPNGQEAV